ncbi:MAG: TPM domain-containing protein [Oscillospiraceae bacterium]|nr:TPM domain-containing protein [Oscillospiraceae bacterium]
MKKLLSLLIMCSFLTLSVGCSDDSEKTTANAPDELSSSAENSKEEKETVENRTREVDTDNTHVYDETMILTDGEYEDLNTYAAWLSKAFKINAAIVLTDDIGDSEPSDYAKHFYESNYSGDGVLFLINNDTNNDYFYRHGLPSKFISDSDVQMLFSEISPILALEDYVAAAERVLEEAELQLPEHFTDRTGSLDAEIITACNDYIKENSGANKLNVYYVFGTGDEKFTNFAKKRFAMFYEETDDIAMLVINGETGESRLNASGSMTYLLDSSSAISDAVKSCYSVAEGMDIEEAVKKFTAFAE